MMMKMITPISTINNYGDKLPDHVHIFSVEEHAHYKPMVLESIEKMKADNNIKLNEKGYYYDFDIPEAKRIYEKLFRQITFPYIHDVGEMYGLCLDIKPPTIWFQQYIQGSDFGWHQHGGHWACIYYVELPEMSEATEFLNYGQFDVKEGDVIFFPTFLVHRSPMIKSNLRKTIIATNFTFAADREMISNYGEEHFRHR